MEKEIKEELEKKTIKLGNENYDYIKNSNGEEMLSKVQKVGKDEVKVVLKSVSQGNSKNIEEYVKDVLGDLYIQRNVKRLI